MVISRNHVCTIYRTSTTCTHTQFRDLHNSLPLCEPSGTTFRNTILAHHFLLLERHLVHLGRLPLRSCRYAIKHTQTRTRPTHDYCTPTPDTPADRSFCNFPTSPRNGGRGNYGPYSAPSLYCAGDIHCRGQVSQQVPKHQTGHLHLDFLLLLSGEPHSVGPGLQLTHIRCCLPSQHPR